MSRFTLPRDVYYGSGSLKELTNLKGKKAIVVTGGHSMKASGFLQKTVDYLKEAGMEVKTFEGVEPDPSIDTVMRGAEAMREFGPDRIVSIGGGSPIDAAKAMWVFYEYPDTKFEDLTTPFKFPKLRTKARFVAIPSTSGTATEVTMFAVITDYRKGIKYPLADFEITPDVAIVDPDIVRGLPKVQVAYTGMDALTHSIESYVGTIATPFTECLSLKAIKMINTYLIDSYNNPQGKGREEMHYAQCLAGMAFSNALLGICHSMAHKTGAAFSTGHVPHGCANAMYLPHVIEYNANNKTALERYAQIATAVGIEGHDAHEQVEGLILRINEMNTLLGIPHSLKEFGVNEKEFLEKLPVIAHNAVLDACTSTNPQPIDDAKMADLLKHCYYNEAYKF
jgi:alcohol dehydrogenase class IV